MEQKKEIIRNIHAEITVTENMNEKGVEPILNISEVEVKRESGNELDYKLDEEVDYNGHGILKVILN